MGQEKKGWAKESGYIWAMVGSAVGFANILRFSAECYLNGGGAFLIPFTVALLIMGIPMLFLEGIIGQFFSLPLVSSFRKVMGPKGVILGWPPVMACATIGSFYLILTGFCVAYSWFSLSSVIPEDSAFFFKHTFLKDSGQITKFGSFSVPIFISMLLCSLFSYFVLSKNIKSGVEKVCSFFLPLLTVLMIFLSIAACFLPGAIDGVILYFKPNFEKIWDFKLWRDIFGHLFFTFSLGLGIVTGYSRHADKSVNMKRAMFLVAAGDMAISLIAGLAVFACLGYLSHIKGIGFDSLVQSNSTFELGFIVFPTILQSFGKVWGIFLGFIFFFCLFIAGITGVFSIIESVSGNIEIEFGKSRKKAVALGTLVISLMSLFFCMGNGQYIIGAFEPMVFGYNMLLGGISLVVVFFYLNKEMQKHPVWFWKGRKNIFYYALKFFVPIALIGTLILSLYEEINSGFGINEIIRWGWFGIVILLSYFFYLKKSKSL